MTKKRDIQAVLAIFYIVVLLLPMSVLSLRMANAQFFEFGDMRADVGAENFTRPLIYRVDAIDRDFDRIQDRLETMISERIVNESDVLPVIITLYNPVMSRDLDYFVMLGGRVTHVYRYVTYGFAGVIPAINICRFAGLEKENLCIIEYDKPVRYHLDVSVPLIRARPIVWDTYGYMGSPNHSIAIIDTGIDDSHPDIGPYGDLNFSRKIVGWYDATPDTAATPEDYGEHGTHCAGMAAGEGTANGLQGSGNIETTFTLELPPQEWPPWLIPGYIDHIDIMSPGIIELNCSWDGGNNVWLILSNPAGGMVKDTSGTSPPLILTYDTVGTPYPTGRYEVFVGNIEGPGGTPFSCTETYPYLGQNDGHNLFTGVAPNSKLVGVKVFDNTGSGYTSTVIGGMDWVIANKHTYNITVASMSIGLENGGIDTTFDQKADTMVENGIVTCVSAGNDFPGYTIGSPGTAAYVITVAATNDQNGITSYSSNGDPAKNEYGLIKPDVAAPGGSGIVGNRIISADSNDVDYGYSGQSDYTQNDYQQMLGTSMSTPHVAGLASLIIDALPSWNWTKGEALKVKMIISMTAFEVQSGETADGQSNLPPLNRGDKDDKEGYGRICADAAIEAATMNYSVGELVTETFGSDPSDKKVWARQVLLQNENRYEFNLSVPSGADYDLYLYNGKPDSYGQPIILAKSVNVSMGGIEAIQFIPNATDTYYIVVKWVSGNGPFNLQSSGILHDITVMDVAASASTVYAGTSVNITVRVKNNGGTIETFDVTAFFDSKMIGMQTVTNLIAGAEKNLSFSWDTTDVTTCNSYTIRAEASVVPGEVSTDDNVYVDGTVEIKIPGDVDGDGEVDTMDLGLIARALGSDPRWPHGTDWYEWNPDCDINNDGKVGTFDLYMAGKNYGTTC